jgi:uncharacterized protein (TIGR02284 family)
MSTTPDPAAVAALNALIQTCKDGEEGFRAAAAAVKTPRLAALFSQYSRQRALFARQLQAAVRRLRGEPQTEGSLTGALQRSWVSLKAFAAGDHNEDMIIMACERAENAALKSYEDALTANLPRSARSTIQAQLAEIKNVHDRIRALEGAEDLR